MGKRKVWNEGTSGRYEIKAWGIWAGRGAPTELTSRVTGTQTRLWENGAGMYRKVRDMARRVMVRPDTKVNPVFRAPYFAFAQRLWKLCVVTGEAGTDEVIAEFMRKSDMYDEAILTAIVEELGLGAKEVVGRTVGG